MQRRKANYHAGINQQNLKTTGLAAHVTTGKPTIFSTHKLLILQLNNTTLLRLPTLSKCILHHLVFEAAWQSSDHLAAAMHCSIHGSEGP